MKKIFNKNFIWSILFTVVIGAGIYLRIVKYFNDMFYIVPDDCHSIVELSYRSISDCFLRFEQGANFLPMYKFLLKIIFNMFSYNFFAFRLPGLIVSCLLLFILYKLLTKVFHNKFVIFAVMCVAALNHNLILFSIRLKPYIFDAFLTLLIIYFAWKIDERKESKISIKETVYYSLFSVFNTFMSIACIAVFQCCWGLLIIKNILLKNFGNIKKLFIIEFFTVVAFIAEYFMYINQMSRDKALHAMWFSYDWFNPKPDSVDALNSLVNMIWFDFAWQDYNYGYKYDNVILFVILILFISGTAVCLINSFRTRKIGDMFLIAPVYFFAVLSFVGIYPFTNRLIVFLIAPIIIITFKVFDFSDKKYVRVISSVYALLYLSLFSYNVYLRNNIYTVFGSGNQPGGSDDTYAYIKELETIDPYDNLVLSNDRLCLACIENNDIYYYRDDLSDVTQDAVYFFLVNRRSEVLGEKVPLKNLIKGKKRIYYNYPFYPEIEERVNMIKNTILASGYEIEKDQFMSISGNLAVYKKKEK